MKFQLNINLSEEDYLTFNLFHNLESQRAQKIIKKSRMGTVLFLVGLMLLTILTSGWDAYSSTYITLMIPITIAFALLFNRMVRHTVKMQVKLLKKTGKLPFDPVSTLEFHEDKIVEITPNKRVEQSYAVLERVCLLPGRYIFLYTSSVGAYILPFYQISAQMSKDEFWSFITEKCKNIEKY